MIDERFKVVADYAETGIEGIRRTGLRVLELRERYLKILMPLEGNVNHVGMMYAGSLFTLGETVGGVLYGVSFDRQKFFPIVTEVTIRFRRPALSDVTVEVGLDEQEAARIQAEAERKGKASFTLNLELKDVGGEVVSEVEGTWQIRRIPEGMENPFPSG